MELNANSILAYYSSLREAPPDDLPYVAIEKKSGGSAAVAIGFTQLWEAVHMRRQLRAFAPEARRELETEVSEQMTTLNRSEPQELRIWGHLHAIHHWSVTADQAEMLAIAFEK